MAATRKTTGAAGAKGSGSKGSGNKGSDKRVREMAKLLEETGLREIEIEENGIRIRVVAGGAAGESFTVAGAISAGAAGAGAPAAAAGQPGAADEAAGPHPGTLLSPMVGTVFVAAEPGADPFVRVGDEVQAGQTVLIVEAMKVMNPIPAATSGKVIEIMVSDAEPVEFGQPLLVIE